MELRQVSDDFFTINNIAVLQKITGNDVYDFTFRNHFECKSVISPTDFPVLLHIGAVEDYAAIEEMIEQMGMRLLINEAEHLRCSRIEKWYPAVKDKTPYTKIYDELPDIKELLKDFSLPVFVKGDRQTNRHNKSQCIIESIEDYERLRLDWNKDPILSWQKVAVREYIPLQIIDDKSFPDMVPISYEFRFFCYEGKVVGYGPYWYMGRQYSLEQREKEIAIHLAEWAAQRVAVSFIAVDLAKTADGEWIVIEVNDAQESGFVGINPIMLWHNTIEAMQERNWLSLEDIFEEGTVIMAADPIPSTSIAEMREKINDITNTQQLIDVFVQVHNKFWFIEDDLYDYEVGTKEYIELRETIDAWGDLMDELQNEIIKCAISEGFYKIDEEHPKSVEKMIPFMKKYGYRDGRGWWVRIQ